MIYAGDAGICQLQWRVHTSLRSRVVENLRTQLLEVPVAIVIRGTLPKYLLKVTLVRRQRVHRSLLV